LPFLSQQRDRFVQPNGMHGQDERTIYPYDAESRPKKRICGLAARTFYIVVAIIVAIIVAGALGGGLGGGLSHRNDSSSDGKGTKSVPQSGSAPPSTITAPPSLSSLAPVTSVSEVIGPSMTLLRDCPASNNSVYSVSLGEHKQQFRKLCSAWFINDPNKLVISKPTTDLNDCINLCASFNVENDTSPDLTHSPCTGVCWRNRFIDDNHLDDDHPGYCFGFPRLGNTSDGFNIDYTETRCDSAALITIE